MKSKEIARSKRMKTPGMLASRLLLGLKSMIGPGKKVVDELNHIKKEHASLQKKYRLLHDGDASDGTTTTGKPVSDQAAQIAKVQLDTSEIRKMIDDYHASMSRKGYNHTWRKRLELILSVLNSGESKLSRVLATVRRTEERRRDMGLDPHPWVINDTLMQLPWLPAAAAYRSAVFEAVMIYVRPTTRKIIETGSGWGEHLCNIFLEGGPFDASYFALEFEEEGRKCSMVLASLDPLFDLKAHFFDYRYPDYSKIPVDDGHTILLTAHSVEQVSEISPDCIRNALTLSREVTGIHFEPVGWQTYPREAWTDITKNHFERCTEMKYNTNLWALLNGLQDEGLIAIKKVVPNFIGLEHNPATLIIWEKVVKA